MLAGDSTRTRPNFVSSQSVYAAWIRKERTALGFADSRSLANVNRCPRSLEGRRPELCYPSYHQTLGRNPSQSPYMGSCFEYLSSLLWARNDSVEYQVGMT